MKFTSHDEPGDETYAVDVQKNSVGMSGKAVRLMCGAPCVWSSIEINSILVGSRQPEWPTVFHQAKQSFLAGLARLSRVSRPSVKSL